MLRELSARKRHVFHESLLGATQTILIEDYKEDSWIGLTDNYVRVKVKSSHLQMNQIVPVKLQQIDGSCLIGEIWANSSLRK